MPLAVVLCDFNPRSHKRSDRVPKNVIHDRLISIHAPTRGATDDTKNLVDTIKISIHAPTRGATLIVDEAQVLCEFQSTLPQEERLF